VSRGGHRLAAGVAGGGRHVRVDRDDLRCHL
jgi:hypothetical protein